MEEFKFDEEKVMGAIQSIAKQADVMQDSVADPMYRIISEVLNQGVWKGKGSQVFAQQMGEEHRELLKLMGAVTNYSKTLNEGAGIVKAAITAATKPVQALAGIVSKIF